MRAITESLSIIYLKKSSYNGFSASVADPHHLDTDTDSACDFDADPDPTFPLMRIRIRIRIRILAYK